MLMWVATLRGLGAGATVRGIVLGMVMRHTDGQRESCHVGLWAEAGTEL